MTFGWRKFAILANLLQPFLKEKRCSLHLQIFYELIPNLIGHPVETYTKWVELSILFLISCIFLLNNFNPMTIFTFMGTFCSVSLSTRFSNIPLFCVFLSPKWTLLMVGKCLDCKMEFIKFKKRESREEGSLLNIWAYVL